MESSRICICQEIVVKVEYLFVRGVKIFICHICKNIYLSQMWKYLFVRGVKIFICERCENIYFGEVCKYLFGWGVKIFFWERCENIALVLYSQPTGLLSTRPISLRVVNDNVRGWMNTKYYTLSLCGSFKCWKIAINVRNRIFRMRWDVLVNQSEQVENVVVVVRNVVGRTINSSSRRNIIKKNTSATITWHPFLVVSDFFLL